LVANWPSASTAKFASAFVAEDGRTIATSYANGDLDVRPIPDGKKVAHLKLTIRLTGGLLKAAAQSPLLTEADRAKIRDGATELEIGIGANGLHFTRDGARLAAAMPDRSIRIIDLKSGEMRDLDNHRRGVAEALSFSPDGSLLAAVERGEYRALGVYDVASGVRIADISLNASSGPKLARLNAGQGFATVDASGRIGVHPVFQHPIDLIRYLAREFPDELTPEQRRAYFIE